MTNSADRELSTREIEGAFLDGHWRYGALIHQTAADALFRALREPSEPETGHALFARLFGEYAGSLETYGAWAWALRERAKHQSFVDAFIDYQNRDVQRFYVKALQSQLNTVGLLRLPEEKQLRRVLERHGAVDAASTLHDTLPSIREHLRQAGEQWFRTDRVTVDAYNKTKHGAPLVRLFTPENPRTFELILRNRKAAEPGEPPFRFASFTVDVREAEKMRRNVEAVTGWIRELAAMAKMLWSANLLHPVQA